MSDEKKVDVSKLVKVPSDAEYEAKMRELMLKKAELELRSLERTIFEAEQKETDKVQVAKNNGKTLNDIAKARLQAQERCTHRKGGNGLDGVMGGQGDDAQFSVLKHRQLWGDVWVRCLRCGKVWKPPLKKTYTEDGKLNEVLYQMAYKEYQQALSFPTRNTMSTSGQFSFSATKPGIDAKEAIREMMDHCDFF